MNHHVKNLQKNNNGDEDDGYDGDDDDNNNSIAHYTSLNAFYNLYI